MADTPTVDESGERWYPSAFVATQHSMIRAAIAERDAARAERDALKADAEVGALVTALPVGADLAIMHDDDNVWSSVVWLNYNFINPDGDSERVGIQHSALDAMRAARENAGLDSADGSGYLIIGEGAQEFVDEIKAKVAAAAAKKAVRQ